MSSFCICILTLQKLLTFFSKNTCELDIVLTRTDKILTTNKLVKLGQLDPDIFLVVQEAHVVACGDSYEVSWCGYQRGICQFGFNFAFYVLLVYLRFFPFINLHLHILSRLFWTKSKRISTEVHTVLLRIDQRKVNCKQKIIGIVPGKILYSTKNMMIQCILLTSSRKHKGKYSRILKSGFSNPEKTTLYRDKKS